ncbi:ABC transporter ATP-binding protein [Actinacidiphila sp. ITFR-21]|uniref:ABC transporter ATP-binding protein n=1 Tax=Actinacidiphila sp. ITFR-21 TaxID=3075199 RepID=UPI00288A4509|nr:ABC transporter ATP-binding protein [Streptomyces sp. ITFR-21]WNI15394.1 ABC transporter ATP-binding protein [Streptomyces sp. ITFR-21]
MTDQTTDQTTDQATEQATEQKTSRPLLEVDGVVKRFPVRRGLFGSGAWVHAVEGVDLTVGRGEVVSLVGESGSGKSTLGRCVTGMSAPTAGRIRFDGEDITGTDGPGGRRTARTARQSFRRRVQPVFQDPRGSLDPRWSVERTIREPLNAYRVGTPAERTVRVAELMALVGLGKHLAERRPRELSGGQQQRVAIAAALALGPDLIVADEPVSALDVSVQAQILNLLAELRSELGVALLFIAHDLSVVEHISDRVAVMYLGRIVETGTVAEIFSRPRHPYTRALIDSIPRPDPAQRMSAVRLTGEIPSPVTPPSGCRFHPRCPVAVDRCATHEPPTVTFGPGHRADCHVLTDADAAHPAVRPAAPFTAADPAALLTAADPAAPAQPAIHRAAPSKEMS